MADLPLIDDHEVAIDAPVDEAWRSLLDLLDHLGSGASAVYARAVGCSDTTASGPRPLAEGSTIPGFHVVRCAPHQGLHLEGRHRFSRYALTFRLAMERPDRTRVSAETRAEFPGVLGQAYRTAVIGTGAHSVLMRRLLAGLRRRTTQST